MVLLQTCRPTGRHTSHSCHDWQRVLLGQARATATGPPITPHASWRLMHCNRDYRQGSFRNGHSDVMSGSSIAMPFVDGSTHPPWPCHAHALCCHSRWPSCQLVSYIRKTAATFHIPSSLLAILPIVTPKLPNSQSITRLLYDYYDLAPVNDCCCACPPATLVNTPTTPSRLLPTERHPR